MDKTTMQRMREHIKVNEKLIESPYRDNKGPVSAVASVAALMVHSGCSRQG